MINFFNALNDCKNNDENISFTVINGESCGEKVLFSGGQQVFTSKENGLLSSHFDELAKIYETGIFSLESSLIYAEKISRENKIIICGAGHVSLPLISLAKTLGFKITVIDDREKFIEKAKLAGADCVICDEFSRALSEIESDNNTFFIVVTRGHAYDFDCLKKILVKPRAYVGMMGSKRRVKIVKEKLLSDGFNIDDVNNIYAPIGLAINAQTPEEIAVSIMAEIIQIKNQSQQINFPDEILRFILEHKETANVLCTIISKKGAGPRNVGTKMLYTNNEILGTIGGGLMEAKVIRKAEEILRAEISAPVIMEIELNYDEASKDGEVCGGIIQVLLECVE